MILYFPNEIEQIVSVRSLLVTGSEQPLTHPGQLI